MRRFLATLAAGMVGLWGLSGTAIARSAPAHTAAVRALSAQLAANMRASSRSSGAEVMDLTSGRTLYARNQRAGRLPASVEKLYTTSTALRDFGPTARLNTSVLGLGSFDGTTFTGTLYLRGGGDPTFGSAGFDRASYETGGTVEQLVKNLITATGIRTLRGNVVADESMFDSLRGTPATGYGPSIWVEGELSAVAFNRGWTDSTGTAYFRHPALEAGQQFLTALRAAGVHAASGTPVRAGVTPTGAIPLSSVSSPAMSTLARLTNTPSDNFFAEMLLKDIGARFASTGTTAAGVGVVRSTIARLFSLHPRFNDGSGLSRYDRTSPADIVSLLRQQAGNAAFRRSLAVAGRTGTLVHEMRGSFAQGRCAGKTGTLSDVSNLVGYCHSRDGHTLAFAFLMNSIYPADAHPIQNRMAVAVARYDG